MTSIKDLTDPELLDALHVAVRREVTALVDLLRHLAEFDRRRLWQRYASSLFVYCTREFGFSEDEAYKRIAAARAAEKFPLIYQLLEQRHVHLTAVGRLTPHLTEKNHRELLWQVGGLTRPEIDALIACIDPKPAVPDVIKCLTVAPAPRLPLARTSPTEPAAEPSRPESPPAPLPVTESVPEPDLVKFQFTGRGTLAKKIQKAKELLWHKFPYGGLGDLVEEAFDALLDKRDPDRAIARAEARKARAEKRTSSGLRSEPGPPAAA